MGACNFDNLVITKGTARDAYNEACEEMNDYNGHQDGYSGDIQTTHGFRMAHDAPRFGTKAFQQWEDKKLDRMDKGECLCIELKGAVLARHKNRFWKGKKGVKEYYFFGMARCKKNSFFGFKSGIGVIEK